MRTFYILDGKKIEEEDITIKHLKRGFLYGDGVFETLRAKENRIYMWNQHIKRLKKSAMVCGLRFSEDTDTLREDIEEILRKKSIKDAYIRINLWRKSPDTFDPSGERTSHLLVIIRRYHPYPENFYREGIRCIISKKYIRNENSPLVYIKSLNYLENILGRMEARNNGYDDAIFLNTSGYLASATVSNLFFTRKEKIYTPSLDCGILEGTIRGLLLNICKKCGIEVKEGKFTVKDLQCAEEIFLTNTLIGVLPVREIVGVFKGNVFKLSGFLRQEVNRKIKG